MNRSEEPDDDACFECGGTGYIPGGYWEPREGDICNTCGGSGKKKLTAAELTDLQGLDPHEQ